jgi:predicted nucleotidyltransferase
MNWKKNMESVDIDIITDILNKDKRVVFAYLYGSYTEGDNFRDVDIAVFSTIGYDPFQLSADLKIALYESIGIYPDFFDVRVINHLIDQGDLFSLLYLKKILETNKLLVDKNFDLRTDFIENYSMKYRECAGLIDEVML